MLLLVLSLSKQAVIRYFFVLNFFPGISGKDLLILLNRHFLPCDGYPANGDDKNGIHVKSAKDLKVCFV